MRQQRSDTSNKKVPSSKSRRGSALAQSSNDPLRFPSLELVILFDSGSNQRQPIRKTSLKPRKRSKRRDDKEPTPPLPLPSPKQGDADALDLTTALSVFSMDSSGDGFSTPRSIQKVGDWLSTPRRIQHDLPRTPSRNANGQPPFLPFPGPALSVSSADSSGDGFSTPRGSPRDLLRTPNRNANGLPPFLPFPVTEGLTRPTNGTRPAAIQPRFSSPRRRSVRANAAAGRSRSRTEGSDAIAPRSLFVAPMTP